MNATVETIVMEALTELALEIVELKQRGSKQRPIFDLRIDRRDLQKVNVSDCARASRAIEAKLDAGPLAGVQYTLEVSSPGMDRPLRHAADWQRFIGRLASVKSGALGGRVEVTIVGLEGEPGQETLTVSDANGEHRVSLAEIEEARLAFHWTR